MKTKKKRLSAAIAITLSLLFAASFMTALPTAFGQFLPNARESFSFVGASPNPVGKGENIQITGWVWPPPSPQLDVYANMTFTVTKPDGTKYVKVMTSSIDGTDSFTYLPDQSGNYTVVLNFSGANGTLNRLPSVSVPYTFTVQEEPLSFPDYTVLPSGRFTWPVSQANYEWWRITGGWNKQYGDGYSNTNWFSPAPETAHILWKQPFIAGGLLGGDQGHGGIVRPENVGDEALSDIVAAHGLLYYTDKIYTTGGNDTIATAFDPVTVVNCVDMYTGERLWQTKLPYINYTTGKIVSAARSGGEHYK